LFAGWTKRVESVEANAVIEAPVLEVITNGTAAEPSVGEEETVLAGTMTRL
jgi:hypothetical protein